MSASSAVVLLPHDPRWADLAQVEAARFTAAAGDAVVRIDHIGSIAIAGIVAKPILDLLVTATSLSMLDAALSAVEAAGYRWRGEYGLPGRRYCPRDDADGRRVAHVHCYAQGDAEIVRHLAFRDYLRARPEVAADYARVKLQCAARHPDDGGAYADCKDAWIKRVEAEAIRAWPQL